MHQTTCGRYLRRFAKYQAQLKDIVRYTDPKTNIIVKTAIGKKWAQTDKLDFAYDASLFASCVYWLTMFQDRSATLVPLKNGNEYTITCDRICYRGDTMNSWTTTLNAFFSVTSYQVFLAPSFFETQLLPEYITEFMTIVYTLGNFFPLPRAMRHMSRNSKSVHGKGSLAQEMRKPASSGWVASTAGIILWHKISFRILFMRIRKTAAMAARRSFGKGTLTAKFFLWRAMNFQNFSPTLPPGYWPGVRALPWK